MLGLLPPPPAPPLLLRLLRSRLRIGFSLFLQRHLLGANRERVGRVCVMYAMSCNDMPCHAMHSYRERKGAAGMLVHLGSTYVFDEKMGYGWDEIKKTPPRTVHANEVPMPWMLARLVP